MLDKQQLIAGIQQINPSARTEWLETFDHVALRSYLDHLEMLLEPGGARNAWTRRGETRAVVTRRPAA